tara:strand:- start:942 stop:1340 length:399 start_codon:yes stop_codon:yes gene_type:complete
MPEFTIEDLVGEAVEGKDNKILKSIKGSMTMTADVDGKEVSVARTLSGNEEALFYMDEEQRKEFGDRPVMVDLEFDGFELFNEELPRRGLEEREKVPYKFKPKRFTKKMKKEALVSIWPAKIKVMKARISTK